MSIRHRGFTLIELLVVVAIISLLLSILLPSLQQARQQAEATVCASNVKQISLALFQYVQETAYYPGDHFESTHGSIITWAPRLLNYLGRSREVFWCPTNDANFMWKTREGARDWSSYGYDPFEKAMNGNQFFSYGYNGWGIRSFNQPHLGLGGHTAGSVGGDASIERRASEVVKPDDTYAISDSLTDGNWDTWITPEARSEEMWPSARHFGGANVLYCDGHVARRSQASMLERETWSMRRWNADWKSHRRLW